ncbi:MAG: permease prefix domain 1-containing protein, partial [Planctomycetota bacterium]
MTAHESHTARASQAAESSAPRDAIAEWLAVFSRTLAVPKREAEEVLAELEDHLRTRVDDLMIGGVSEPEAIRQAITELGETVELARRFRESHTIRRRRSMIQALTLCGVAAALGLSVFTASTNQQAALAPNSAAAPADAQGGEAGAITGFLDMPGVLAREDEPRITYTLDAQALINKYGPSAFVSAEIVQELDVMVSGQPGKTRVTRHVSEPTDSADVITSIRRDILLKDALASVGLEVEFIGRNAGRILPEYAVSTFEVEDAGLGDLLESLIKVWTGPANQTPKFASYDYRVREGVVQITTEGGFELIDIVLKRYETEPLTPAYADGVIRQFIRPDLRWNRESDDGPSTHSTSLLLVNASPWIHDQVRALIEELRSAKRQEIEQQQREARLAIAEDEEARAMQIREYEARLAELLV